MTDEQINKIWRDLQNRYWESNEEMHIRFARALLAANPSDKQEAVAIYEMKVEGVFGRWDVVTKEAYETCLHNGDPSRVRIVYAAPLAQSAEQEFTACDFCAAPNTCAEIGTCYRQRYNIAQSAEQDRIDARCWRKVRHQYSCNEIDAITKGASK